MPGILIGLLLCVFSIAEASLGETGEFFCGDSGYWVASTDHPEHTTGKRFLRTVTFSKPFVSTPAVFLSITYLDSDRFYSTNVMAQVKDVSESGFRAMCFKWRATKIFEMGVTWLAIPKSSLITTGEINCPSSGHWDSDSVHPERPYLVSDGRHFISNIHFLSEFKNPPVIGFSVTLISFSEPFFNMRFLAKVSDVTGYGFRAMCYKWADTEIWEMRISWFAIPFPLAETGGFYCGRSSDWTAARYKNPQHPEKTGRRFVQNVRFSKSFTTQPVVFLSVTLLDNDKSSNLRYLVHVENISISGFTAMCYTWSETKIFDIGVTWFAF